MIIAAKEVAFIQLFFYAFVSKQKIKMKAQNTMTLEIIQKLPLLKTREFHFSLAWLM